MIACDGRTPGSPQLPGPDVLGREPEDPDTPGRLAQGVLRFLQHRTGLPAPTAPTR